MPTMLTTRREVSRCGGPVVGVDRRRALTMVIGQIERRFGRGAIWRLDPTTPIPPVPVISTGSLPLDLALGVGGLPRGRSTEIYGPEASGKTTLALSVIAQAQQTGGIALFIDAEHALDLGWAKTVGVDVERLLLCQPDCAEHALGVLEVLVQSGALDVAVIDSVAALVTRVELEGEVGDATGHLQSVLMASAIRKLAGIIRQTGTTVIFCNQLRERVGMLFGNTEHVPGGRALKHHASVRLDVRRRETLRDDDRRVIGSRVRVRVVKNKVAVPFRAAELDLRFHHGLDAVGGLLDLGLDTGLVAKAGATLTYQQTRLGVGREQARQFLGDHPDLAAELHQQLSSSLASAVPGRGLAAAEGGRA
jgi:recombination protein RecA